MTIKKSQAYTLNYAGVYLPKPVLCNGQLYVVKSYVTSPSSLWFLIGNKNNVPIDVIKNILYKEVFNYNPTPL